MKLQSKWLLKTLILTCCLLIISAMIGRYFLVKTVYNTDLLIIDPKFKTVIVGASHSATSINPDFFENTISLSRSGEPIFFTYYKIKKILENNPSIKKVIFSISSIHISKYAERSFFKGGSGSRIFSLEYYMFVDDFNDPLLPIFNADRAVASLKYDIGLPFNYMEDLKVSLNYYTNKIDLNQYKYFGGYESLQGSKVDLDTLTKRIIFYFGDKKVQDSYELSNVGITSIKRIMSLAEKFDIDIHIINTPMHKHFYQRVPDFFRTNYYQLIEEVTNNYKNIYFHDYANMPFPDEHFLDGDHLNSKGADVFSKKIASDFD